MGIETPSGCDRQASGRAGPMRLNFPMGIETSQRGASPADRTVSSNETQLPNGN